MRLLAIDTATPVCGVALAYHGSVEAAVSLETGQTHTRTIMDTIRSTLRFCGIDLQQIDGFAVTQGPGSFTGLRIGISTVKGLAMAMDKPMTGVSTLEALASQAHAKCELICPMIDARRGEVYWTLFRRQKGELLTLLPEQVGPAEKAAEQIEAACCFIGNGAATYRQTVEPLVHMHSQWVSDDESRLSPAAVARIGWRLFQSRQSVDPGLFAPVYLRKSDAEINLSKCASVR
jgi:tRNA threonylcarbamoyladenosine biosynthesis protein TsaB